MGSLCCWKKSHFADEMQICKLHKWVCTRSRENVTKNIDLFLHPKQVRSSTPCPSWQQQPQWHFPAILRALLLWVLLIFAKDISPYLDKQFDLRQFCGWNLTLKHIPLFFSLHSRQTFGGSICNPYVDSSHSVSQLNGWHWTVKKLELIICDQLWKIRE